MSSVHAVGQPAADGALETAGEVMSGHPGPAGRRWLGWVCLLSLVAFAVDTTLVLSGVLLHGFDEPVARAVQNAPWGVLTRLMELTNNTAGWRQDLFGLVVVLLLFWYERRAGWLMALGAIGSLIDQFAKVSIGRHRPTADIVQILNPSSGYSYPSGHAVFFTWLYFMLAAALAPRLRPRWRPALWALAALLILLACLGRVWAGAHWPTDVIGGFLLGLSWSALVLWLPERWLPSPSWRWVGRGRPRQV